ncbi:MAG TPA: hypothetical protein VHF47_11430 [Acidimicrobiales bacterium]|nr:hypothetical protein [Acidimicrobiales bacterium]
MVQIIEVNVRLAFPHQMTSWAVPGACQKMSSRRSASKSPTTGL